MALNATTLATEIVNKFELKFGEIRPAGQAAMQLMAEALSEAIIEHITANAEVRIETTDGGLQRDPVSPYSETLAPTGGNEKTLNIT